MNEKAGPPWVAMNKTEQFILKRSRKKSRLILKSIYEEHQQPTNQQPLIIKHEQNKLR